jgi:hypothetical protein
MDPVSTPETSASPYQTTWHNIPEDSNLQTRRHEDLTCNCARYEGLKSNVTYILLTERTLAPNSVSPVTVLKNFIDGVVRAPLG